VALLALLAFGCTTIRAPASAIGATIPVQDGAAEPQVELWLESGRPISPGEAARARAEAREALQQALAPRRVAEGEQVLVVRAQGVSRTASRRSDQRAAVAGMIVGAVVVVAVVVVSLVAGKGGGGKGGGGKLRGGGKGWSPSKAGSVRAPRPGAVPVAVPAPRPPPVRVGPWPRPSPVPVASWKPPRPAGVPSRSWPHSHVWLGFSADVHVPLWPLPEEGWVEAAPLPGFPQPDFSEPEPEPTSAPPGPEAAAEVAAISLPPLQPLEVERRGFFAGDALRLELTLVDRSTGDPLWVKTIEKDVDPRDGKAVRALVDGALDDPSGWLPATPAPAPAG
jgi:hypothetical protein